MCTERGDEARARALREEYLELARATGNQRMVALGVRALAGVATEEGRISDALSLAREAYEANREVGDSREVANDLRQFAETLAAAGNGDAAAQVLSAAEALIEEIGGAFESWVVDWNKSIIASIRTQLDEAAFAEAWEKGRTLTPDEAVALALDVGLDE
jgi:ATP/maltotriose-dependent transcriptional regulator MalT